MLLSKKVGELTMVRSRLRLKHSICVICSMRNINLKPIWIGFGLHWEVLSVAVTQSMTWGLRTWTELSQCSPGGVSWNSPLKKQFGPSLPPSLLAACRRQEQEGHKPCPLLLPSRSLGSAVPCKSSLGLCQVTQKVHRAGFPTAAQGSFPGISVPDATH